MRDVFAYFGSPSDPPLAAVELTTLGHQHVGPGDAYPRAGHPATHDFQWEEGRALQEHHIVYLLRGAGTCEVDGQQFALRAGDLLLIKRGDWHRYRPEAQIGWEAFWAGFRFSSQDRQLTALLFEEGKSDVIALGRVNEIVELFETMLAIFDGRSRCMSLVATGLALQLLGQITEGKKVASTSQLRPVTREAVDVIHREALKAVTVRHIASKFSISYGRFRANFKEDTGVSPHQYILNERIDVAKRLLRDHYLDIASVAFEAGFESPSYFSRLFKRKVGVCPSEWRARTLS